MTVRWTSYAQSRTKKPVKGRLTGPATTLAWSFVRDDQPLGETARQVALAPRDETRDLEAAGIRIIQVDEPALRELPPVRKIVDRAPLRSAEVVHAGTADSWRARRPRSGGRGPMSSTCAKNADEGA